MSLKIYFSLVVVSLILLTGCGSDEDATYIPKPRGYFRIDFPEKSYHVYDNKCPYSFEIPTYATIEQDGHNNAQPCWINVTYPKFNAKLHLSYKAINNDLNQFIEDSREFAIRHQIKATGLDELPIIRDSAKVYGLVYDISGNTASSVQFYLTDSTHHFLRGALYFNSAPNIDSSKIVIDYLKKDILHLIKTCKWK